MTAREAVEALAAKYPSRYFSVHEVWTYYNGSRKTKQRIEGCIQPGLEGTACTVTTGETVEEVYGELVVMAEELAKAETVTEAQ